MNQPSQTIGQPIFHVLRRGEEKAVGPYSQEDLVGFLNSGAIKPSDYVYHPDLEGWKTLSRVFDLQQEIPNIGNEGQDPVFVTESYNYVDRRSEPAEDIYFVAVQHLPALSLTAAVRLTSPKSIVLTNHRVCIISQKFLGVVEMKEYPLEQIRRVLSRIKHGHKDGIFQIDLHSGQAIEIDKIPFAQLDRLDEISPILLKPFQKAAF